MSDDVFFIPHDSWAGGISFYEKEWGIPFREVSTIYVFPPQGNTLKKIPTIVCTSIPSPGNSIAGQALEHQQIPVIPSRPLLLIFHPEERDVTALQSQVSIHRSS